MSYPLNKLNEEERKIYTIIYQSKRIKMAELARQTDIGAYERYEQPQKKSTQRKVRKIVHDLRINHRIPVLFDIKGYFIAHTKVEAEEFMSQVSSRLKSHLITYHTLKKMFDVECKEVEEQLKLFDLDQEEAQNTLL
jgi:hypothetical protein